MKLSLCITTYNRPELTIEAFEKVYTDNRIDEIIIVDDHSDPKNYDELCYRCKLLVDRVGINKIVVHWNSENLGMSRNKKRSLELAKNNWCILFDSDNVLDKDYLNAFYHFVDGYAEPCRLDANAIYAGTIFCPDFAKPDFNYTKYSAELGIYGPSNIGCIKEDAFNCLMNTCNYIVNRQFYLNTYQYNPEHVASDTIWHNYNHLKAGGIFAVVPNMQYFHRVHKQSGFMQNVEYNIKKAEEVRKLIAAL